MSQAQRNDFIKQAIIESAFDPAYFCRFFLRKWFRRHMPAFHLGLLAMFTRKVSFLDKYPEAHEFLLTEFKYAADPGDPESTELPVFWKNEAGEMQMIAGPNNAVIVPRGFSKTTLMNAANLYELCTDPNTFCVYVSESADHAERQLGNIKRQLERNQLLREAYGDVVPKRSESEKWGADEIQLKNGAILLARGRGSQVRGLNYDGRRPNRILLDDVEDKESVSTAPQRKKVSDWFYADVVPAGNMMEKLEGDNLDDDDGEQQELQITVLGTLLHSEALLITLQKDVTFNHIRFGAVVRWNEVVVKTPDGQGEVRKRLSPQLMLWPDKMGAKTYTTMRNRYKRTGKLAEFSREIDSEIRIEEDAMFQYHNITLYLPTPLDALIQRAMACDHAISDMPGRDHTALVVGGRREDGVLWVIDEWGGLGKKPREVVDKMFEWYLRYQPHKIGIEAQQYQKSLIYLMQEEMARRQLFFAIMAIFQGNDKNKHDRISGILQPRYANGYIRHQRPLPMIESQLQDFPNGKMDYIDAEAMMFQLLGETQMLAAPEGTVTQDEYPALEPAFGSLYSGNQTYLFSPGGGIIDSGRYG